jgi:acid phosphatase (class B)
MTEMKTWIWFVLVACVTTLACSSGTGVTLKGTESRPRVGFDVDDTLLTSSPAFDVAYAAEGVEPRSEQFWTIVNSSDEGHSLIKQKTRELLASHQAEGAEIFVITARHPPGGDGLRAFLERQLGIEPGHVFFETEGKAERIRQLGLQVFYGDSDSDITAAIEAGAEPIRILRSARSTYTRKYNPGKYGEQIIQGSED